MAHSVKYNLRINACLLGLFGIMITIISQLNFVKTKNDYDKIKAAMNANTSKGTSCTSGGKHFCNSVAPATWKNNIDVAKMFYTQNEAQDGHKSGQTTRSWNINTGPSHPWGPAPIKIYTTNWYNTIAIVESANNLGYALGALNARKNNCQLFLFIGITLLVFSLITAIESYFSK